jgi:hypothetical protein
VAQKTTTAWLGSLALNAGAQTDIELAGTTHGSGYDAIFSFGNVSLNGTLNVSPTGGFKPLPGNSFDILDWGSLAGTFSTLNLSTMNGSIVWDASQLYTTGTLSVSATYYPGDFNRDSHVNAADILAMEKALANPHDYEAANNVSGAQFALIGDVNGDGKVTNADLQLLLANLEAGNGSNNPVPEPLSILLLLLGTPSIIIGLRRRQ